MGLIATWIIKTDDAFASAFDDVPFTEVGVASGGGKGSESDFTGGDIFTNSQYTKVSWGFSDTTSNATLKSNGVHLSKPDGGVMSTEGDKIVMSYEFGTPTVKAGLSRYLMYKTRFSSSLENNVANITIKPLGTSVTATYFANYARKYANENGLQYDAYNRIIGFNNTNTENGVKTWTNSVALNAANGGLARISISFNNKFITADDAKVYFWMVSDTLQDATASSGYTEHISRYRPSFSALRILDYADFVPDFNSKLMENLKADAIKALDAEQTKDIDAINNQTYDNYDTEYNQIVRNQLIDKIKKAHDEAVALVNKQSGYTDAAQQAIEDAKNDGIEQMSDIVKSSLNMTEMITMPNIKFEDSITSFKDRTLPFDGDMNMKLLVVNSQFNIGLSISDLKNGRTGKMLDAKYVYGSNTYTPDTQFPYYQGYRTGNHSGSYTYTVGPAKNVQLFVPAGKAQAGGYSGVASWTLQSVPKTS